VSNQRVTTAPLTLSTGHTIPSNTHIGFASYAVHTSAKTLTFSPSYNPAANKPPSEFDGFRFYNLRAMEGKENRHQFVTTSPDSLIFGHGSHACPGRFFASNEIKVVIIELLRSWDFRFKDDVERKGGEDKRPKSSFSELGIMPNKAAEIEFKRRKV
jgi:cytochrome P450